MERSSIIVTIGLAFYFAFFGYTIFPTVGSGVDGGQEAVVLRSISMALIGAATLIICILSKKSEGTLFLGLRVASLASAVLILCSVAGVVVIGQASWLNFTISLVSALHITLLSFSWMLAVTICGGKEYSRVAFISMLLAAGIVYMVDATCSLFDLSRELILQTVPFLSTLLLFALSPCEFTLSASESRAISGIARDPLVKMIVVFMVYDFGSGLFRNVYIQTGPQFESFQQTLMGACIAVAVAVFITFCILRSGLNDEPPAYFWMVVVAICMATLYAAAILAPSSLAFCNGAILSMRFYVVVLIWIMLGVLARRYCGSCVYLVGAVFLPFVAASRMIVYGPWSLMGATGQGDAGPVILVGLVVAVFILTIVMFWYLQSKPTAPRYEGDASPKEANPEIGAGAPALNPAEFRNTACFALQEKFSLTDREREVLGLLSEGNSQKKIAETLYLSVSSVQAYSKTLYRKLDIHSKQEAIDLVNAEMESKAGGS